MLHLDGCQAIGGDGRRFGPLFGRETAAGIGGSKKMRRDDRFSGPTTHVSPTALNLAQNAQKSEPIWKNKPSINKSKAHYAKHTKTTRRFRQSANRFAVVLALAAGAAGVWSELKAAPVTGNAGSQMPVRGSQIDVAAGSDTNSISGSVSENGDGTATVSVFQSQFAILSGPPNLVIQTFNLLLANDPANTTCSQTVNIKPGASGKQTGSGTGSASLTGDILDFSTFNDTPVAISFAMTVDHAADGAYAFNNHTLNVTSDPVSGQLTVSRVVSIGTAAYGSTAASLSILVNGAPYDSETGVYGQVEAFDSHSVTRLR